MGSLSKWVKGLFSKDRRKTDRVSDPKLAVYYWADSKPVQYPVRDISPTGIYILTDERWYPGTVVKMTIQRTDGTEENFDRHIAVESRAVRSGEDGVGMSFVLMENPNGDSAGHTPLALADKKTMEKFLQRFWNNKE